jgi:acyl transferase domain-containing protein
VSDRPAPDRPAAAAAQLHPLLAYNSSTLKEVSFQSSLSDTAFYAVDHRVHDQPIFPGAGFLEMACISANVAGEQRVRKIKDVVWIQPLSFQAGPQSVRTVLRAGGDFVEYAISSLDDENESILHSEGRLTFRDGPADRTSAEDRVSIEELKARCAKPESGAAFYDRFREYGLHYGPAFRTVQELYIDGTFALAKLKIADHLKGDFVIRSSSSMIDGALQTVAGLVGRRSADAPSAVALDESRSSDLCRRHAMRTRAYRAHTPNMRASPGSTFVFSMNPETCWSDSPISM